MHISKLCKPKMSLLMIFKFLSNAVILKFLFFFSVFVCSFCKFFISLCSSSLSYGYVYVCLLWINSDIICCFHKNRSCRECWMGYCTKYVCMSNDLLWNVLGIEVIVISFKKQVIVWVWSKTLDETLDDC